jgi:hypothetical protein
LAAYESSPVLVNFMEPVAPVPSTGLAAQIASIPGGERIFIYASLPLLTIAMCSWGCCIWSLKRRIVRKRAAERALVVRM